MGQSPHGGKYEIRTENEKILAEEVGRPIAEVARGRAYLSECAVYGKGLRQVFALWVRPRAKVVVHGFDKRGLKSPLLFWVQGVALPLGEPRVLIRSVKTHTGLLLTKVTKPCIMDSSKRKT